MGGGSSIWREGKRDVSDLINGRTCDVWKTGKMFGELGRSRVMVECTSSMLIIVYGPLNLGMNFTMRFSPLALYSLRRCKVDNRTREPILKGNFSVRCLLDCMDCEILAHNKLSCASSWHITCQVSTSDTVVLDFAGMRGG